MIGGGDFVVLDTNVLVYLARGTRAGSRIESDYRLTDRAERPCISVVTVGEARSLALQWDWGAAKVQVLEELLRELVIVPISRQPIIQRYAEIDFHNRKVMKPARPVGKNDTWIAATASSLGGLLITSDTDFDHLATDYISLARVDARSGETLFPEP